MGAALIRRPEGVKVTYRRMKFAFEDEGFERYWHGGSPFRSLFWTQLSTAFEPGEKFFIDSARALKGEIDDPALQEEIMEFCRQEGHHTAQHLKFDRMNAEMGIDIDGCRARYTRLLDRAREKLEPMEMLAATMALEHFTAGFADQYFSRPHISAGADRNVHALWAWHAAEEAEHKGTCFDIYRELGGGYFTRIITMPASWFLILALSVFNTFSLLRKDKKLWDLRDIFAGLWYLFGFRGLITGMLPSFLSYFSPRFHPWKTDNSQDIRDWQNEYGDLILNPVNPKPDPSPATAVS
ncbi:MAG: metal-dependent hydrolase [Myxococcales bacterium]|nr:metal-dependent hydrolase [Myxococcales bacterium]